ncbi:hypothetical protein O181_024301 [Austropuccinia psidii MF-1]|uniref:Uncharacterized protein n=1 Tax=Austropuccinia psidii MF-1 TaxID=1389203 RepID=A0A9Q3GYI0_9BASI|nr:hypothetical protein [Austropuccinia psidii MF-1]
MSQLLADDENWLRGNRRADSRQGTMQRENHENHKKISPKQWPFRLSLPAPHRQIYIKYASQKNSFNNGVGCNGTLSTRARGSRAC